MSLLLFFHGGAAPTPQIYGIARAGSARSGAARAGYFVTHPKVFVNGIDRSAAFLKAGMDISLTLDDSPGSLSAELRDFIPTPGDHVYLARDGTGYGYDGALGGVRDFGGHVVAVTQRSKKLSAPARYDVEALDYRWRAGLYALVTKRYDNQGINTILHDLCANYTDDISGGRFRVGYAPSSLGNASVGFQLTPWLDAVNQLAQIAGAYWMMDAERRLYMAKVYPRGNSITLDHSGTDFWDLSVATEYRQTRNQTWVMGQGVTVTSQVLAGAYQIAVDDVAPFSDSGGYLLGENQIIAYGTRSGTGGPGTLNSISPTVDPVVYTIDANDTIRVLAVAHNAGARGYFAGLSGIGGDGISAYAQDGGEISAAAANNVAAEDVALFGSLVQRVAYTTRSPFAVPGAPVSVNLTSPVAHSGLLRVQRVSIRWHGSSATVDRGFYRTVDAAPMRRPAGRVVDAVVEA